jgi:hypothetical protein
MLFGVATMRGGVMVGTDALAATSGITRATEIAPRRPAARTELRFILSSWG